VALSELDRAFCGLRAGTSGILVAIICLATCSFAARADIAQAEHVELKAETYTSAGQTSGCGLSFVGAGVTDGGNSLGLSGSANVLWVQDERKVTTMVKVGALLDLKPAVIRLAWVETKDQGRSRGWNTHQTGNPPMLLMIKEGDFELPATMAGQGFTLGASIDRRPLDDSMRFPAASTAEQLNLKHCIESLLRNLPAGAR
jgi:hypothetical protein